MKNLSSQEKSERNQEDASYAEIVRNVSSLDNMTRTENNERQNATELSYEAEIGTTAIYRE